MNYDKIILDLISRVTELEDEVKEMKTKMGISLVTEETEVFSKNEIVDSLDNSYRYEGSKDTTKYLFNGIRYPKNRLVLAVVIKYMQQHPETSAQMLMKIFDKSLQGSLGVVQTINDLKTRNSDYQRRFFTKDNELIKTTTEYCVVCTQWGIGNIKYFIKRAESLGYEIQEI